MVVKVRAVFIGVLCQEAKQCKKNFANPKTNKFSCLPNVVRLFLDLAITAHYLRRANIIYKSNRVVSIYAK